MKKTISILSMLSIFLTFCFGGFTTTAQKPTKGEPKQQLRLPKAILKNWDKLPVRAKQALTPEAKAKWESFTPKQREKLKAKVFELFRNRVAMTAGSDRSTTSMAASPAKDLRGDEATAGLTLNFINGLGQRRVITGTQKDAVTAPNRARATSERKRADNGARAVWNTNWAALEAVKPKSGVVTKHHAVRPGSPATFDPQAGCAKGPEQFIRTFFEASLVRPPHADELSYWLNNFAQAQSQGTLLTSAQALGNSLFLSAEYANRGRLPRDFVEDCYRAFLQRAPDDGGWNFWTGVTEQNGQPSVVQAFVVCGEFSDDVNALCSVSTFDGDHDGLPDNFENNVADNFTPYYHVSQYESDNYSTFLDAPPQTVKKRFGQTPVSHFRVVPLSGGSGPIRYNSVAGRWESFLRIDYWTMWDHDSGLVGDSCDLAPGEQFFEGFKAHDIDDERSGLLVSAPATWTGNAFAVNLDPSAYSSVSLYTAAHESTVTEHNCYYNYPQNPRPAGDRVELWQSLSKHGTYAFNPDGLVLLREWQREIVYQVVYELFSGVNCDGNDIWDLFWLEMFGDPAFGWGCETWFAIAVAVDYYVTVLLFACATESFYEQGSQLANIRINLGEPQVSGAPGNPINGSSFIQEDTHHLFSKLVQPLQFESLF